MSNYENYIYNLLKQTGLIIKREVEIPGVRRKQMLRYDFGIYSENKLIALIEVNGEQHYHQVAFFQKTHQAFEKQKEYDRIKISACLARKIPLYIIPYCEVYSITSPLEIFSTKHRAKTKWHNDKQSF